MISQIYPQNEDEKKVLESLYYYYKVAAPGAKYMASHKTYLKTKGKMGWDGMARIITKKGQFLSGLIPTVVQTIEQDYGCPVLLEDKRLINTPTTSNITVPLRDYQLWAIEQATQRTYYDTWWPRGVLKLATGAGKTEIAVAMYQYMNIPSLFLVHKKTLLNQTVERFRKYGIDAGKLGDSARDVKPNGITVSTIQTLSSLVRGEKFDDLGFLQDIQQIFYDEAHLIAATLTEGNQFAKISAMMPGAYARWGLTATPFMRDTFSDSVFEGVTGPLICDITNKYLIDRGFLTPPIVHIMPVNKVKKLPRTYDKAYEVGIILNVQRNKQIIKAIEEAPTPCIILANRVAHIEILQSMAAEKGMDIPILHYKSKTNEREKVLEDVRKNKGRVLCTKIFDEGLDFPSLKSIILGGAGKSEIKQLQRVGRVLRLDNEKDTASVYDFADSTGILKKHFDTRILNWKAEGFRII